MTPKLELQIKINYGVIKLVSESDTVVADITHHKRTWYSYLRSSSFSIGDKTITLSRKGTSIDVIENEVKIGHVDIGARVVLHLNGNVFDLYRAGGPDTYYLTNQKNPIAILTGKIYKEQERDFFGIFHSPRVLYFSVAIAEGQELHYEFLRLLMIGGYCIQVIFEMNRS